MENLEDIQTLSTPATPKSILTGWVNMFVNAGDAAIEIAGSTAYRFRQAKTEIVTASKVAYRFLAGMTSNESSANSNGATPPRFQQPSWFKNLINPTPAPSTSEQVKIQDQDTLVTRQDAEAPLRLNPPS